MSTLDRRQFLKTSAGAVAGVSLAAHATKAAPNDVVRVAVCGIGGRGYSHMTGFENLDDVQVVAVCDVDSKILNAQATVFEQATGRKLKRFVDMRELFADKEIDAVSFATPNHWHSLGGIWAMQAGKDVYVEKPLSHNVWEGRQLVNCARKLGRICQHGTQTRSSTGAQQAIQQLRDGVIGDVYLAKGLCYKWRDTIGKVDGPPSVPENVNYDLWTGPAQMKPLMRKRLHYDWHWQWDYGNGDIGNQGVHQMDLARWALGVGLPSKVVSMGGHLMFDDDQETPNVLHTSFEYPDEKKVLQFEVRHWITNHEGGFGSGSENSVGVIVYGSEGYMTLGGGYKTYLGKEREPGPSGSGGGDHFANFIGAVRSRNHEDLTADVAEGHVSSALCHLANIAYRCGRAIEVDCESETIKGDDQAAALLARDYRSPFVVPSIA